MNNTNLRTCDNKNTKNLSNNTNTYKYSNLPLLIVDLILLPIQILRMVLIYFWGSKYNLKGFTFLDVIMHADNPFFNQEDCRMINTIGKDYRIVLRDDSRIFPMDINYKLEKINDHQILIPGMNQNPIFNPRNSFQGGGIGKVNGSMNNQTVNDIKSHDSDHSKKLIHDKTKSSKLIKQMSKSKSKSKVDTLISNDPMSDSENSETDSDSDYDSEEQVESDDSDGTQNDDNINITSDDSKQIKGVNYFEELNSAFDIE